MRLLFLLCLYTFSVHARFEKKENIRIYSSNTSISKVAFNIAEVVSLETGIPVNISFEKEEEIAEKIFNGEKVDILITDSYELVKELRGYELINFAYVSEAFYDRLVFVPLAKKESLEIELKSTIFFKTSPEDKDVISISAEKIPSILIESSNVCRKINSLRNLYDDTHDYIIIKESVARKCDFYYAGFFNDLYSLYYIAIIQNDNFSKTKKAFDFIETSEKVKEIIKTNGYSK